MTTTPADKPDDASAVDPGAIVQMDGIPCECRFRTVEGAIRHGSETGELVDPDVPIQECDLHKALRERVAELAGALDNFMDYFSPEYDDELMPPDARQLFADGRAALLATPAKALERARLTTEVLKWAGEMRSEAGTYRTRAYDAMEKALDALDALGEEVE
jgi:hypothetical protein